MKRLPVLMLLVSAIGLGAAVIYSHSGSEERLGTELTEASAASLAACADLRTSDQSGECMLRELSGMSGMYRREALLRELYVAVIASTLRSGEDCHSKMHLAGQAAGEVYGHDALIEDLGRCDDGYYHGAVTAYRIEDGPDTVCRRLQEPRENLACWHGYGHLAWLSGPADSWDVCRGALHEPQRAECTAGVGMEAAISLGGDALLLCSEEHEGGLLYSCIAGAANNAGAEDPYGAVAACPDLQQHQDLCWKMVGGGIKTHLNIHRLSFEDLSDVISVCAAEEACAEALGRERS